MKFPDIQMGGSEQQYFNVEHLIPKNVNLMLNHFNFENKFNLHWQHQYFDQPSVLSLKDKRILNRLDGLIFVSYHQKEKFELYHNIPKEKSFVIRNAIWPMKYRKRNLDKINLIYTSTPFRGLNILVGALDLINNRNKYLKEIVHLDVFSSMKLYGEAYEDIDNDFKSLYDICNNIENITYHGSVLNKDMRPYLEKAHIFAYPNTWEETSCIAVIEAMSAGCLPVISSIGALPETCGTWAYYYNPISTDTYNKHLVKEHIEQYSYELEHCIINYLNNYPDDHLSEMNKFIERFYSWDVRLLEWENYFKNFGE